VLLCITDITYLEIIMVALNIRISDELSDILTKSAKYLDRPKGYVVRKALEVYLLELQEDIEDYNDAIEILAQNNPTVSWEEVQRNCGLLED
jgi:predicted DNA-binding protein